MPVSAEVVPDDTPAPACDDRRFELISDIAYADGSSHLLDLRTPLGDGPFPTVIWIHGGGWMSGDKEEVALALRLVCRGYALAAINYRPSAEAIFPAQIQDVKAAIRFLRANADTYRLEPQRFAAFGASAGGYLAALAGTASRVADLDDPSMGNGDVSSDLQAVVDWYGPMDFSVMDEELLNQGCFAIDATHGTPGSAESLLLGCAVGDAACIPAIARANPLTYIDGNEPPFLIQHGTADCVVPHAQSSLLYDSLQDAGVCSVHQTVTGAEHGGTVWMASNVQDLVGKFLDGILLRP